MLSWKEWQKKHNFREENISTSRAMRQSCRLDTANPGWYDPNYRQHGLALRCDYPSIDGEGIEEYWNRIRLEITSVR